MAEPRHPGQILLEDYMQPSGLSCRQLARSIKVPATRISRLTRCLNVVTAENAIRLAGYFGGKAETWLELQNAYDLHQARAAMKKAAEEAAARKKRSAG